MQAVIMAGGFGTRLRPITCSVPKPMALVANRPMLSHIIELLKQHNFNDLTMMLYYQPEIIKNYFKNGKDLGVSIKYLRPEADLGTAGSVGFARENIKDTFLVISGDVLTDFDISKAIEFHKKKKAIATMVLTRVENPLQFGVVITDKDGKVERFLEKPSWGEVFSDTINTGIYILEPEVFDYIPENTDVDFSKNLFPKLLKEGKPLYGYIADGYWKDIGNHDEYRFAHYDILDEKVKINVLGSKKKINGKTVILGKNSTIEDGVIVDDNVIIGDNTTIKKGAKIGKSVIGSNVTIEENALILGSVIWNDVNIGPKASLKEVVIGTSTKIEKGVSVQVGTIIADECLIGEKATIKANLRIWPHKIVEKGAILSSSLVWGAKWNKALFNAYGSISGLGNIEITPEFAAKIGSAYGAYVGNGAYVVISRDDHRTTRMIKRGIISGILSAGVNVGDMLNAPIPVARYEIGNDGEIGGIHIRQSPYDAKLIDIKFFDKFGSDISISQEKSIEQLFFREDFKRADMDNVGMITVPPRANEFYKTGYLNTIQKKSTETKKGMKIVVDYAHSTASLVFPTILGELGVDVVALNAYIDAKKITKSKEEFDHSLNQLSDIVTTLKADVGFLLDNGAEKVFLVDERGKIIDNDTAMLVMAYLVMSTYKKGTIAVPVTVSSVIDELAKQFDFNIIRTGTSPRNIMKASKEKDVIFVADCNGGFIFPEFQNSFDAMYAVGNLIKMLSQTEFTISMIRREIPSFEVFHKAIPCSWDKKGQVMRNAIEYAKGKKTELIDGVKIFLNNGWVLLLPDPDEAYFHIWAEARDKTTAKGFIDIYTDKISEWQK
ncbi:MAG: mannose-1-phosphate guanyltransferase [Elusimicrobia bacterium]|nr:mannose-1-phosphate guanyltransferase [Elusimicrobiota bacterium]